MDKVSKEEHIKIHKDLHSKFDQLLADFIYHTGKLPSKTTVTELMEWSYAQTKNPLAKGSMAESAQKIVTNLRKEKKDED